MYIMFKLYICECIYPLTGRLDVARPDKISGADINAICQEVSLLYKCFI